MSTSQLTIEEPRLEPPHEPPIPFILSSIALFSIPGALLRIWIQQAFTFDGTPLNPVAIPQILGCFIAGLVRHSETLARSPLICMGLLIGLCGSLTSFSSWMFSVFSELANYHSYNRSVGQSFVSGLMDIIAILFLSFGSYYFGSHLMKRYHKYHPPIEGAWFTNHVALKPKVWEWTFLGSAIGLWALMILLSVLTSINKSLWLSGSLAPLGTWTRFLLSSLFNNRNPYFPYGTFLANVSGSSLISILYILSFNSSMTGCVWIVAAQSGFCGCLTTVSTLMVELHFLKFKYAWRYGALSISAGLLSIIIVFGSFMWSSGVDMSNSMCLNV